MANQIPEAPKAQRLRKLTEEAPEVEARMGYDTQALKNGGVVTNVAKKPLGKVK